MLVKRISSIEFSVLSPDMIRKMSALEIKSPETYDKDGYPMENGLMDPHLGVINPGLRCKTCGQQMKFCPGHFGHLELVRPVVHSEFGKKVEELLSATCMQCGRIALPEEKIKALRLIPKEDWDTIPKKILLKTRKVRKCPHCSAERHAVLLDKPTNFYYEKERLYPTQIRDWLEKIPAHELELFGYDTDRIRPEWFVLTALQAPPITIRPSITLESGIKSEDDLTHKLVDIIRINLRLKDNIEAGAPQLIIEDLWDLLQYHVTTYFDNNTAGVPPAKHRSGRALRTLVQRLKGKKGRFRYNLTGKRVNFAARSTISPDPYLGINELGVPEEIAKELTVPEFVTEWNIKKLKELVKKSGKVTYIVRPNGQRKRVTEETSKEIEEELAIGYRVERELQDGDTVLFNRQPSLHRLSMLAHIVRVMPGKTFRFNPIVAKPYNADFDGDEMNMHVPQTEEGKTEAKELMFVQDQIISPRHGGPVIILDEDGVSGCFILTRKSTTFAREEAMQYLYETGFTEMPSVKDEDNVTGKELFSQLLPKGLNLEYPSNTFGRIKRAGLVKDLKPETGDEWDAYVRIQDGKLLTGIIDAESTGEVRGKLVDAMARNYPPEVLAEFYAKICRIAEPLITRKGLTAGLDEYETTPTVEKVKAQAIAEEYAEAEKLVEQFNEKTLEHIPGRTLKESFEIQMLRLGARVKEKVEGQILMEKVVALLKGPQPKLNTTVMILSGSRGNPTNLTNISGLWGQASVREGRPKRGYHNRLITINRKGDVGAAAGGFISNNFMEGLTVREFFYHAMGGRQGEVDTGVSTKVSGYLYRRLANSLKDLIVHNDNTVRTANKNLIQFTYGEDGVMPKNSIRGKNIDVEKELNRFKKEEEKS